MDKYTHLTTGKDWLSSYLQSDNQTYAVEDMEPFIWPVSIRTKSLESFLWPEVIELEMKMMDKNDDINGRSDPKFRLYNLGRKLLASGKSSKQKSLKNKTLDVDQALAKNKNVEDILMEIIRNSVKCLRMKFVCNSGGEKLNKCRQFLQHFFQDCNSYLMWKNFPYSHVEWKITDVGNVTDVEKEVHCDKITYKTLLEEEKEEKCIEIYSSNHNNQSKLNQQTTNEDDLDTSPNTIVLNHNQLASSEINQEREKTNDRCYIFRSPPWKISTSVKQNRKVNWHNSLTSSPTVPTGHEYHFKCRDLRFKRPDQAVSIMSNQGRSNVFHKNSPISRPSLLYDNKLIQKNDFRHELVNPVSSVRPNCQYKDQRSYIPMIGRSPLTSHNSRRIYQNQQFCNNYFHSKIQTVNFSYQQSANGNGVDSKNSQNCQKGRPVAVPYFPQHFQMSTKNQQQQRLLFVPQLRLHVPSTNQNYYFQNFSSLNGFNSEATYQKPNSCSNFRSFMPPAPDLNPNFKPLSQFHYGQSSTLQTSNFRVQQMKTSTGTYKNHRMADGNSQQDTQKDDGSSNNEKNIPVLIRKRKMKKQHRKQWKKPNCRHEILLIDCSNNTEEPESKTKTENESGSVKIEEELENMTKIKEETL
ncbi:uncharacterized protein LOC111632135 [Centruroides sculpturatus]|uniref:uncharacterized protein LOC111632135 n=1 Tax=Centruroides sculpturatus TaxID=218467 RepID=UPI000C6EAFA9|nr:uncharacterized protein LOC111632135 [Centruroides sculpturatus]XP_023232274.1 uncharacterized protein LOC111632135 [Centruroides sculpturatus]XP_023232275.1 uncharacterized protein LOC111632135 [Centruroides sculpturatus]XP_023232276.1 uncharacterized protein LOC111632135 [Centruroides sculpturatus]XP_023232277.1 uncharacterized protein LOC111632135 [Centruroides sculpturatus]